MADQLPLDGSPLRPATITSISRIESIISVDPGNRGVGSLLVPNDLLHGAAALARLKNVPNPSEPATVVILSGFPCCVNETPPTETDGPPGAVAIAQAAVGLGHRVILVTDECNRAVFEAALRDVRWATAAAADVTLQVFPPDMTPADRKNTESLAQRCDLVIACERAGPARDGRCYTMRGIDMNEKGLIAPLHELVEYARDGERGVKFVAIGDGGNEMGMGKVYDQILACPLIKDGEKIGAVTKADHLIAAGVSNWGGYALGAAAALIRADDDGGAEQVKEWLDRCVPAEEEEVALLDRCVGAGCRDGVSGRREATVDGMPLEVSLECLRDVRAAALHSADSTD